MKTFPKLIAILGLAATLAASAAASWPQTFNSGPNVPDDGKLVATDSQGNVFVCGGPSIRIVKYSPSGQLQYARSFSGLGGPAVPTDMKIDANGIVYVSAISVGSGTGDDMMILKMPYLLREGWTRRYNSGGAQHDGANSVALDDDGNVYITGYTTHAATGRDYTTIKYDSAGTRLWVRRHSSVGNFEDVAAKIVTDGAGGVYVTGTSKTDMTTLRYDGAGNILWTKRYNGGGNLDDGAVALALDPAGNAVVGGSSISATFTTDFVVAKYDRGTGAPIWVRRHDSQGKEDIASDMAVDAAGNVAITGTSGSDIEQMDYLTVKYDNAGVKKWVRTYTAHNYSWGSYDVAYAVAMDEVGNVYITGTTQGDGTNSDYDLTTVKYSAGGAVLWTNTYDGGNGDDSGSDLTYAGGGQVFVTGTTLSGGTNNNDFVTLKL